MGAPEAPPSPFPSPERRYAEGVSKPYTVAKLPSRDLSISNHSHGCTVDLESTTLIYITSYIYPPRGLPPDIYTSIMSSRTILQYEHCLFLLLFNFALILQILVGAAVTAIGASMKHGTAVTILAAATT